MGARKQWLTKYKPMKMVGFNALIGKIQISNYTIHKKVVMPLSCSKYNMFRVVIHILMEEMERNVI